MRLNHIYIMWKKGFLLCAIGFLLAGCHVQATESVEKEEGSVTNLNYELVDPPYDDAINQAISQHQEQAGLATVQHQNHTYAIITLGQRPSAGYKIVIKKVEQSSDKIIVSYSEQKPTGMALTVISYPAVVVKLPATKLAIQANQIDQ
ncbi:hypothetical protein BEP19_00805 [Ammoniphilus oxalaticus]|uniref:PrcB C-terminal domain-containing protein n=1 Tax=Ammoniphilus oxalaticus TaxID=66863 RepID=A0A419SMJ2_9BACL|nr:protease complex subunit PrcB family protein [Ammoniphilus oxalaticus]RKD25517.1 hypothetical protein BEP19_00805 [Ammoniphilus oxalaticus]